MEGGGYGRESKSGTGEVRVKTPEKREGDMGPWGGRWERVRVGGPQSTTEFGQTPSVSKNDGGGGVDPTLLPTYPPPYSPRYLYILLAHHRRNYWALASHRPCPWSATSKIGSSNRDDKDRGHCDTHMCTHTRLSPPVGTKDRRNGWVSCRTPGHILWRGLW